MKDKKQPPKKIESVEQQMPSAARQLNPEILARSKFERLQRLRVVVMILPAFIGFVLLLLPQDVLFLWGGEKASELFYSIPRLLGASLLATSALAVIMMYLQTGFKRDYREAEKLRDFERQIENQINEIHIYQSEKHATGYGDNVVINGVAATPRQTLAPLSAADAEKLSNEIIERIQRESGEALLKRFEKQAEERVAGMNHSKFIEDQYKNSTQRLNNEITALGWRGNLNLGLGILTTTTGLGLLGYFVIQNGSSSDQIGQFAMHFIPRISLVIFIEIFALFFLKLYKATLAEIKFFQNELTNIESRLTALRTALAGSDAQALSSVLAKLADTERNFILKKDESTVHLELQKSERAMATDISKHVAEAVAAVLKK